MSDEFSTTAAYPLSMEPVLHFLIRPRRSAPRRWRSSVGASIDISNLQQRVRLEVCPALLGVGAFSAVANGESIGLVARRGLAYELLTSSPT
jgi:hypothetical protein